METGFIIGGILDRIDRLEERYWQLALEGDIKACAGFQSCIELRMKIFGLDGKVGPMVPASGDDRSQGLSVVDPTKLSEQSLSEVLQAIKENQKINN